MKTLESQLSCTASKFQFHYRNKYLILKKYVHSRIPGLYLDCNERHASPTNKSNVISAIGPQTRTLSTSMARHIVVTGATRGIGGRGGGLAERTACIAGEKAPEQERRQTPSAERALSLDKPKAKGGSQAADQEQNALGVLPGDTCTRSLHLL